MNYIITVLQFYTKLYIQKFLIGSPSYIDAFAPERLLFYIWFSKIHHLRYNFFKPLTRYYKLHFHVKEGQKFPSTKN